MSHKQDNIAIKTAAESLAKTALAAPYNYTSVLIVRKADKIEASQEKPLIIEMSDSMILFTDEEGSFRTFDEEGAEETYSQETQQEKVLFSSSEIYAHRQQQVRDLASVDFSQDATETESGAHDAIYALRRQSQSA